MKVIDALNKIANEEKVRFKILNDDDIYHCYKYDTLYNETQREEVRWYIDEEWLNKEVEILEEDKPLLASEELENRIENALEFLETQYNTFPSGQMWREALKNVLQGKETDNVYEPFEEDKKIEKLELVNNGNVNAYALLDDWGTKCALTKHSKIMVDKINEIIDYLNNKENK